MRARGILVGAALGVLVIAGRGAAEAQEPGGDPQATAAYRRAHDEARSSLRRGPQEIGVTVQLSLRNPKDTRSQPVEKSFKYLWKVEGDAWSLSRVLDDGRVLTAAEGRAREWSAMWKRGEPRKGIFETPRDPVAEILMAPSPELIEISQFRQAAPGSWLLSAAWRRPSGWMDRAFVMTLGPDGPVSLTGSISARWDPFLAGQYTVMWERDAGR